MDYLKTIPKKPLLASPVKMMALMAETPGLARGVGMPYYGCGAMSVGYVPGSYGYRSQLTVRERPTIEKLCLSRLDVPAPASLQGEVCAPTAEQLSGAAINHPLPG